MDSKINSLRQFIKDRLSDFLGFEVPDELIQVVLSTSNDELDEYFSNLLDKNDIRTRQFINELKLRKGFDVKAENSASIENNSKQDAKKEKNQKQSLKNDLKQANKEKKMFQNQRKNKKQMKLFDFTTKNILLEGRYICNCEAQKHELIANCLNCGRIVCEQEGSGPCVFCNSIVCSRDEQLILNEDGVESSRLYEKLAKKGKAEDLLKALKERDKLLDFDQNCADRTRVIDDEADYFSWENIWLTPAEREKKKKEADDKRREKERSRFYKPIKIVLDPNAEDIESDRDIDEDTVDVKRDYENINRDVDRKQVPLFSNADNNQRSQDLMKSVDKYARRFQFLSEHEKEIRYYGKKIPWLKKTPIHKEIPLPLLVKDDISELESRVFSTIPKKSEDEGYCLSIHQPFASLIIAGIKKYEGRTWYTPYKGFLWIASTGRKASPEEIKQMEKFYELCSGVTTFPKEYPSGVILGRVELVECLTQDAYSTIYPNGEIEDPYVFMLENPEKLPFELPNKGKPNIYKLEPSIFVTVKNCLNKRDILKKDYEIK